MEEENVPRNSQFVEPQFSGARSVSRNWEGFKKSLQAVDKKRRYNALCKSCGKVFLGVSENLKDHKKVCSEMPPHIASVIEENGPGPSKVAKITTAFKKVETTQEDLDELMAKAIISGDVPFR